MNCRRVRVAFAACCVAAMLAQAGQAQVGTQFTYQGELQVSNALASGQYEMSFAPFAAATGGAPLSAPIGATVSVVNGRFTVLLDFGAALNNTQAFLEISVRPAGSGQAFEVLSPRQKITPTPNALFAAQAATAASAAVATNATSFGGQLPAFYQNAANINSGVLADARLGTTVPRIGNAQTFTGANTFSNVNNAFTGIFTGNGAALTNINASNITAGTLDNFRTTATASPTGNTIVLRDSLGGFLATQITASNFAGSGAGLTNLNAGNITSSILANARTTGTPAANANTLVLRDAAGNFSGNAITAASFIGNGSGLTNLDAADVTAGTLAAARLPATVARTDIGNAFGNFTNSFLGNVGIGTTTPGAPLHVADSGIDVAIFGPTALGSAQLMLGTSAAANGYATIQGVRSAGSAWGDLTLNPQAANVTVGTVTPQSKFHVRGDTYMTVMADSLSAVGTWLTISNKETNNGRYWNLISAGTGNGQAQAGNLLFAVGQNPGTSDIVAMVLTRAGNVGIGTGTPSAKLEVVGTTRTSVLEITGGSDIAEPYCVAPSNGVKPVPGMVVSIDPDQTGKLRISSAAYDTTVAGIISGANGVNVGLTLRQEGNPHADGSLPIANVGRVWAYVDADAGGAVKPGDLLTTSSTPGHAMKAEPGKANGAVLGKAMSRLDSGKGMVLVLVGLQ